MWSVHLINAFCETYSDLFRDVSTNQPSFQLKIGSSNPERQALWYFIAGSDTHSVLI